jgi:hypothetical protein
MFSSLRRVTELAQHAGSEIYIHSPYGFDHSPGIGEEWRNVLSPLGQPGDRFRSPSYQ